jgi:hypothetical protein
VREVSGRDHAALQSALTATSGRRPLCVVAAVEPAR